MVATITPGYTFTSNDFVTAAKLNDVVGGSSMRIEDMDRTGFDSSTRPVTAASTAPTSNVIEGELWFDTTNLVLYMYKGGVWSVPNSQSEVLLTNKSGSALSEGDVCVVDTANASSVDVPDAEADEDVLGVAADGAGVDSTTRVVNSGIVRVNLTDTVSIGDYILANGGSTFDDRRKGKRSTSGRSSGVFAVAVSASVSDPGGGYYCTAAIFPQPSGTIPQNALMYFEGPTCPTGWSNMVTEEPTWENAYTKITANGGGATGGANDYGSVLTGDIPSGSNAFSGLGAGSLSLISGGGTNGQHAHTLAGISNEPKYVEVVLCRKD